MTPSSGRSGPRILAAATAVASVALGLSWSATAQAASLPLASSSPGIRPAATSANVLVGWAGLTQDAPLAGARVRILSAEGKDITREATGLTPPSSCAGASTPLCTQSRGVFDVPLTSKLRTGDQVVVSGGQILGTQVSGAWRAEIHVARGVPSHTTVTLGTTVQLRLRKSLPPKPAARRTLAALGLHVERSVGFTERHDAATLDQPGVIAALGRMGLGGAADATESSALRRPGKKAAWLVTAETAEPRQQTRLDWDDVTGAIAWVSENKVASAVVSAAGSKLWGMALGWMGMDADQNRIDAAVAQIKAQLDKDFAALQQEMAAGFASLNDLASAHATAQSCQAARNLVSTGISTFENSLEGQTNYMAAWDAYVTAVSDEESSPASIRRVLQEMSKWSTGSMSKIGQTAYLNAFSPLSKTASSTSLAAGWQADLQCLGSGGSVSTASPLIADTSWPVAKGGTSGMPIVVQSGLYYTAVSARGALLDSVFAAFVQACGAAPTPSGTCATGASPTSLSTSEVWGKVFNPKCKMSISQQVSCSSVNYYATLANALISPVPTATAIDYRTGEMWSMARVNPHDVFQLDSSGDFYSSDLEDVDSQTCTWQKAAGSKRCPNGFELATRAQVDALIGPASASSVSPVGSNAQVDNVGMPTTAGPLNSVTYADVINAWFPSSPSRAQAAAAACGGSTGTGLDAIGVHRGAPAPGTIIGFGPSGFGARSADCTGSYGVLLARSLTDPVCPASLGQGDFSGPEWNVKGDGNASDGTWAEKEGYKGNSLAVGFGYPQPSSGAACAGWVYVNPPTLSNFWGLSPTGDQPDVAAAPMNAFGLEQYLLDGTQTSETSNVAITNATDSGHDPSNYPSWKITPLSQYYSGVRYAAANPACSFRSDIAANAVAIWGSLVPLCADVTVPTLVVRETQNGDGYLYQDAWASQNQTACPSWEASGQDCGPDGNFVAVPTANVTLTANPVAPAARSAVAWSAAAGSASAEVVARRE